MSLTATADLRPQRASYMPATYDLAVFIGRFQPFHLGHLQVIEEALDVAENLVILIGSADQPRDYFNPWTFHERREMIYRSLPIEKSTRVLCLPLLDHLYNDTKWILQVQDRVGDAKKHFGLPLHDKICLVGHQKDGTSFYLKLFPQWSSHGVMPVRDGDTEISATKLREAYFLGDVDLVGDGKIVDWRIAHMLPPAVWASLKHFAGTAFYRAIRDEYLFVERYKEPYKALPYPPIFVTVDAVVVQSGHVLLVQRKARPGQGLWALPGGFLNSMEHVQDGIYRELREETSLKVPEPVLRGSTITTRVFDAPYRSSRGRTITHAALIHLKPDPNGLPRVKGADDAEKARWFPLADVRREMMFEDHWHIIQNLTALI